MACAMEQRSGAIRRQWARSGARERRVPLPRRVCDAPARRAAVARAGGRMTMDGGLTWVIAMPHDAVAAGSEPMPRREWLVTNGLGGYSSSTVAGVVTRRYHGLLVAALPAPLGRIVMLNHLLERVRLPSRGVVWLGDEDEVAGPNAIDRADHLIEFRLELGLPVWRYAIDGYEIEKRVLMPHGQN